MDDPPLVRDSSPPKHVSPNLDSSITGPKQLEDLNTRFKNFFAEVDARETQPQEQPPSAESVRKQEIGEDKPKESEAETPAEASVKESKQKQEKPQKVAAVSDHDQPAPEPPVTETQEEQKPELLGAGAPSTASPSKAETVTKDALEAMTLGKEASEGQVINFKRLKEIANNLREQNEGLQAREKLFRDVLTPLLKEFGHDLSGSNDSDALVQILTKAAGDIRKTRAQTLSPEIETELESLRSLHRAVDILNSAQFKKTYEEPMLKTYHGIIDDLCRYMPGNPEKVKEFSDTLHTKCGPMDVKPERWQEYLDVAKEGQLASAFDIGRLQNRISKLTEQQMDYQEEARKLTSDQNGYDQWKAKQQEAASLAYGNIIRDSVAKALAGDKKHLSKYAVQVTEGVKDPQKLRELADHNAKATKIEESFRDFLIRFNSSAEGAALATLDYIEANEGLKEAQEELKEANTQLKDIKAAFEKLKGTNGSEVEELKSRIKTLEAEIGTRRKVADIPMKPVSGPAKGGRDIAKLPKGQDGGLREAFKNWQTP